MPKNSRTTDPDRALRLHLVELLSGGSAQATFDDVIKDLPAELRGDRKSTRLNSSHRSLSRMPSSA